MVLQCLQSLPAHTEPPVCRWDEPAGKITDSMSRSTSCPTDRAPYIAMKVGFASLISFGVLVGTGLFPARGLLGFLF